MCYEFNKIDNIATISRNDEVTVNEFLATCDNCDELFKYDDFMEHECQYDDRKKYIFDDITLQRLWKISSLQQMFSENNKQIVRILDQLKGNELTTKTKVHRKSNEKSTTNAHHVCSLCHRMYVHASGLARHFESHNDQPAYCNGVNHKKSIGSVVSSAEVCKCFICGRIYSAAYLCIGHLKSTHAEQVLNENGTNNFDDDLLETNFVTKISIDSMFQCEYCDGSFISISTLMKHQVGHDANIGFECSDCEIASRNMKFMLNHRKNECPFEMYAKNTKINLKRQYVCDKCEAVFDTLAQLYEHRFAKIFEY